MDDRSLQDDTILIVERPQEEDGGYPASVRGTFEVALRLLWYAWGRTDLRDDQERVEATSDGILREDTPRQKI